MNLNVCKNNIVIISQPYSVMPFCGFELWIHFGAATDPEGMSGIAHFLEHLMCSAISKVDPYFYHNMSASTSKDRIRIGGIFGSRHANEVIASILDCVINLKVDDFYYSYQKQKVIYEIQHLNKAPILEYIETFETNVLKTDGYEKSTFGLKDDIENIEFTTAKEYLEYNFQQGMTISLVGAFDIKNIEKYLETMIPVSCKAVSTQSKPLKIGDYKKSGKYDGVMLVYDLCKMACRADATIIKDYLTFALNDFPITTKQVEYKNHQAICVYIPDNMLYFEQFAKVTNDIDVDTYFPIVREYQMDCLHEKISCPNQYACFNIESYCYGDDKSNISRIQNLSSAYFEGVIKHFFSFKPIRIISETNKQLLGI
jgi:hypothetical protein